MKCLQVMKNDTSCKNQKFDNSPLVMAVHSLVNWSTQKCCKNQIFKLMILETDEKNGNIIFTNLNKEKLATDINF